MFECHPFDHKFEIRGFLVRTWIWYGQERSCGKSYC